MPNVIEILVTPGMPPVERLLQLYLRGGIPDDWGIRTIVTPATRSVWLPLSGEMWYRWEDPERDTEFMNLRAEEIQLGDYHHPRFGIIRAGVGVQTRTFVVDCYPPEAEDV